MLQRLRRLKPASTNHPSHKGHETLQAMMRQGATQRVRQSSASQFKQLWWCYVRLAALHSQSPCKFSVSQTGSSSGRRSSCR